MGQVTQKKGKRLRKRAKDSEKRTKDSEKGQMEGVTEDSEKTHKRLRKRGQHQKHRSALRALKYVCYDFNHECCLWNELNK